MSLYMLSPLDRINLSVRSLAITYLFSYSIRLTYVISIGDHHNHGAANLQNGGLSRHIVPELRLPGLHASRRILSTRPNTGVACQKGYDWHLQLMFHTGTVA